jgi:hypothetical protein
MAKINVIFKEIRQSAELALWPQFQTSGEFYTEL